MRAEVIPDAHARGYWNVWLIPNDWTLSRRRGGAMKLTDTIEGYRIGWKSAGFRRRGSSDRFKPWHRPWQAEASGEGGLRFARRSFTKRGAERKMKLDWGRWNVDGRLGLYQQWKLLLARAFRP